MQSSRCHRGTIPHLALIILAAASGCASVPDRATPTPTRMFWYVCQQPRGSYLLGKPRLWPSIVAQTAGGDKQSFESLPLVITYHGPAARTGCSAVVRRR